MLSMLDALIFPLSNIVDVKQKNMHFLLFFLPSLPPCRIRMLLHSNGFLHAKRKLIFFHSNPFKKQKTLKTFHKRDKHLPLNSGEPENAFGEEMTTLL